MIEKHSRFNAFKLNCRPAKGYWPSLSTPPKRKLLEDQYNQRFTTTNSRLDENRPLTCKFPDFYPIPDRMTLPEPIQNTNSSFIIPEQTCQRFTLAEIQSATNNFDEALVVGSGGYGKVYKCSSKIGSGNDVAIKRLYSMSDQGASEFEAEVKVLSKLRHGNLVSLIGYCNEEREMILVYEFMPHGTLENQLRKVDTNLPWLHRLKICIGAARGLEYLHTGTSTRQGVIHRDVKTSNILLDENFDAKISDFGLAKVGPINQTITFVKTKVKGTYGYMDPCYFYSGKLTRKTDVYSFGVVLFEVLTGRQAVDPTIDEDQWSLAVWAQDQIKEGKVYQIIDSRLMGEISKKCLKEFTSIACCCLHNQPKRRPTMSEVVVKLESILSQERENANYSNDGRFINKVRSFFTGKEDLIPIRAVGRKSGSSFVRTFTMTELRSATNNFKNKECSTTLPRTIYKGWVDERTYAPTESGVGLAIYVRKSPIETLELDLKPEEFNHPNLVKLLGCCLNEKELYCVYELLPDASLDKLLFGEPRTTSLSWVARLKIAVRAARGLSFLHQRGHRGYCQFKTSCILVDKDCNARLWDFEVQKSFESLGSYSPRMDASYAAPECFSDKGNVKFDGILESSHGEDGFGVKNEIYAFGVVLLEILTGMKVYDVRRPLGKQNLVKWATPLLEDHINLGMIMDPQLQYNTNPPNGAFRLALLVSNCLQRAQEKRPSMDEILQVLCQCYLEESKTV